MLERVFFFAKRGTSIKSHTTHAAIARNKRGSSVEVVWILTGFYVGFARNLILFLFEREREGYKRFADCTVHTSANDYKYSFFPATVVYWNRLLCSVISLPTLDQFSVAVRSHDHQMF